ISKLQHFCGVKDSTIQQLTNELGKYRCRLQELIKQQKQMAQEKMSIKQYENENEKLREQILHNKQLLQVVIEHRDTLLNENKNLFQQLSTLQSNAETQKQAPNTTTVLLEEMKGLEK